MPTQEFHRHNEKRKLPNNIYMWLKTGSESLVVLNARSHYSSLFPGLSLLEEQGGILTLHQLPFSPLKLRTFLPLIPLTCWGLLALLNHFPFLGLESGMFLALSHSCPRLESESLLLRRALPCNKESFTGKWSQTPVYPQGWGVRETSGNERTRRLVSSLKRQP